jgi:type IV fimbrial biogenesis protein FimT
VDIDQQHLLDNQYGRAMLNPGHNEAGFTLVELLIGVTIMGILLVMGLPSFKSWIQNTQIRTATEAIQNGLELARAEAVRRNTQVRFQLTNSLDNTCALTKASGNWVVSLDDPTGDCAGAKLNDAFAIGDAVNNPAPRIIQVRQAGEGSANVVVGSKEVGGGAQIYDGSITFNGVGRIIASSVTPGNSVQIDITNPVVGGNCVSAGGPMRCLRVTISSGGLIRACNPLWSIIPTQSNYDPQGC